MTLALLLTAVTGAWAVEPTVYNSTVAVSDLNEGDILIEGAQVTLTSDHSYYLNFLQNRFFLNNATTPSISGFVHNTTTVTVGVNGLVTGLSYDATARPATESGEEGNAWEVTAVEDKNVKIVGITYTAPAGPKVDWNASTKTGTFAMPGSDVVLTPIYAEATIYQNDGETEKQAYASLKEAFAAVQDGDIIKLDWNVTLHEQLTTPERNGDPIHFMLDFNGYTITDGSEKSGYNCIELRNGDVMFLTDESKDKNGGLKGMVAGLQGSRIVFVGGRYDFGEELAATNIKNMWVDHFALGLGWSIALGMEFIDLNNGSADADGFFVCVGFKTFELAIDSKRFATFYSDMNIEFAEQPAEGVGLYTISSIDADRSTATVTPISGIIPAKTPMLVYNGTEQKQTAKLIVTLDDAQGAVAWAPQFKGTATDHEFTADDMAAADYYALSGGKAFAPVKGAGILGANQCWLQFDKQEIPSARQFTLVFDSEATGIKTTDCTDYTDSVWYDLNGRKVAAPSKKGIYIMNGKKVVVK